MFAFLHFVYFVLLPPAFSYYYYFILLSFLLQHCVIQPLKGPHQGVPPTPYPFHQLVWEKRKKKQPKKRRNCSQWRSNFDFIHKFAIPLGARPLVREGQLIRVGAVATVLSGGTVGTLGTGGQITVFRGSWERSTWNLRESERLARLS